MRRPSTESNICKSNSVEVSIGSVRNRIYVGVIEQSAGTVRCCIVAHSGEATSGGYDLVTDRLARLGQL